MGLGNIGDEVFTTGLILPYLDRISVGLHSLLRVRINFYACGYFFTRADDLLRVLTYAYGFFY